jgi:hypothetical protein
MGESLKVFFPSFNSLRIERRKFKVDKNLAWAFIVKHIDATIADKIKLTRDYDMHYAQRNVLFL